MGRKESNQTNKQTNTISDATDNLQSMSEEELMEKLKPQLIHVSAHGDGKKILLIFDAVNQVNRFR